MESVVWLVDAATGPDGVRGKLSLAGGELSFRSDDPSTPSQRVFPLREIRKVKRVLGSPVLEIRVKGPNVAKALGLYFVRPPRLGGEDAAPAIRPLMRHASRRQAVVTLRDANKLKKAEIREWVARIRKEMRKAG